MGGVKGNALGEAQGEALGEVLDEELGVALGASLKLALGSAWGGNVNGSFCYSDLQCRSLLLICVLGVLERELGKNIDELDTAGERLKSTIKW